VFFSFLSLKHISRPPTLGSISPTFLPDFFLREQDEKLFGANDAKYWRYSAQLFGKIQQSYLAKFSKVIWQNSAVSKLVKLNSKIFAKHCVPATFCLAHKLG